MSDQTRPDASADEHDYFLSVEEAADRYAAAGHPRTIRAIQKYCRRGDLESQKVETTYGERYLISSASIDRHIAMIVERSRATIREQTRSDAAVRAADVSQSSHDEQDTSVRERPRSDVDERYVKQLERENEFLREQMITKDGQIKELTERSRETNVLIGGLQRMLSPLLGSPDPHRQASPGYEDVSTQSPQP